MNQYSRRRFLSTAGISMLMLQSGAFPAFAQGTAKAGRLKQSVARWCFAQYSIEELCQHMEKLGVSGMDLVGPEEWETCKKYGITPCMVQGAGTFLPAEAGSNRRFGRSFGWNKTENHAQLLETATKNAEQASAAGLTSMIGLFGDREGMSDEQGIENCVIGLRKVLPILEKNKVTLSIELLNSLVDHPDYQGNNTAFGAEVCRRMDSEYIKLVYDIYHMQIMEGNLISTIRQNINWISHFHVAGVPGRNEIDETQEVNWHAVASAIADLNFKGYIAHEWIPAGADPLAELTKAVSILTV